MVVPELTELLFEKVCGVQPLVCFEKFGQAFSPVRRKILLMGQEGVLLAFDELAIFARQPGVFVHSYLLCPALRSGAS